MALFVGAAAVSGESVSAEVTVSWAPSGFQRGRSWQSGFGALMNLASSGERFGWRPFTVLLAVAEAVLDQSDVDRVLPG